MFTALTMDNMKISIEDALPGENYLCPVCGNPVIVKAASSDNIRTHFAHKRNALCLDSWKHDMSDWHFEWQSKFPLESREVIVKNADVVHRADILINNTVIEFQHSPISSKEFEARNNFYKNCGYSVVWLFDTTDKMKIDDGFLVWKRKTTLFSNMKTPVDALYVQHYLPEDEDNILRIEPLDLKEIHCHRTICPIKPVNFLKEYGGICDETVLSIRTIFEETKKQNDAYNRMKKELEQMQYRAEANAAFNRLPPRGHRGRRRF